MCCTSDCAASTAFRAILRGTPHLVYGRVPRVLIKGAMTNHPPLYAPVQEIPRKLFLAVAALLAVLPFALYIAINFFHAPIFPAAWGVGIMPGWPLALFLTIQGLPNTGE